MSSSLQKGLILFVMLLAVIAVLFMREQQYRHPAAHTVLETWAESEDPNGTEIFRHEGVFSAGEILTQWRTLGYSL